MKNLLKFFTYFGENKRSFYKYFFLSLIVGLLELFGVALTYPFVLKLLSDYKGIYTLTLGLLIVFLFLLKSAVMIVYSYYQARFTKNIEKEIHLKFVKYFLATNYYESSRISLAQKGNILSFIVPNVINNYILRIQNVIVNVFIFMLITALLLVKFTEATIVTIICAILLIYAQNKFFKPRLQKISEKLTLASEKHNQAFNESLINLKGVKVSNNEYYFYENYKEKLKDLYKNQYKMMFLNIVPPYITEPCIIILLFVLLTIITLQNYSDPQRLVASFAIIVSAIFRLAPAISRIQVNLNGISSSKVLVDKLLTLYETNSIGAVKDIHKKDFCTFNNCIELKQIYFEYEKNKPVLNNINLKIKKGEFLGIAGLSGAGKTTLIDIISGLLCQTGGDFLIDGIKSNKPLKIGYIPQEISTINASIKENVIFGTDGNSDNEKIIDVLKKVQLYDFILKNYSDGINANPFVDSTGFSQGQKQRLAIARALYSEPDIIILDEATSSLDLKTEDEICNVLENLKGKKTIIAVAHRLSTIKSADKIAFLNNGTIENCLPFNELYEQNQSFKELVELASIKD